MSLNNLIKIGRDSSKFLATNELFSSFKNHTNPQVAIKESRFVTGQKSLTAITDLSSGTLIFTYTNHIIKTRTRTSIQVGPDMHIEAGSFGMYTNHSCSPNALIETQIDEKHKKASVLLLTICDIKKNEEITFDYATTENVLTDKASKLDCLCGSEKCRGKILGFDLLSKDIREELVNKHLVARHLL